MAASRNDIDRWIKNAKEDKKSFILSVCDTFDWDDYPVYCETYAELVNAHATHNGRNMQRINEIIWVKDSEVIENLTLYQLGELINAERKQVVEITNLLGRPKPTQVKILFVRNMIAPQNIPLISCEKEHIELISNFEINDLSNCLVQTELNKIPADLGFYTALLELGSITFSIPKEPTKYDITISINNIKKVTSLDEALNNL